MIEFEKKIVQLGVGAVGKSFFGRRPRISVCVPSGVTEVEKKADGWTLCYEGVLNDGDEVSLHATFIPKQKPIDFTTNMPAVRMATAIANEKWNRAYFARLQQIGGQCHYEQEGVLEGELTLNGKACSLCLPCVRDHSFGRRDWNDMNNHLWLMAVSAER